MIVAKFGGSSVKDLEAMRNCLKVIRNYSDIQMVVISATYNTTNQLEELCRLSTSGNTECSCKLADEILERHWVMGEEVFDESDKESFQRISAKLKELVKESKGQGEDPSILDSFYAFGELISSLILTSLMRREFKEKRPVYLDARDFIVTDSQFQSAVPNIEEISRLAKNFELDSKKIYVTQGFIAKSSTGETTTLGREGSDYSAALFAEAFSARELQIWTDVEGVAICDPRLVEDVIYHQEMDYEEAALLAECGAKVLFPRTLAPAKRVQIPVYVGSTRFPKGRRTKITELNPGPVPRVLGLVGDEKVLMIIGRHLTKVQEGLKELGELIEVSDELVKVSTNDRDISSLYQIVKSLKLVF